MFRSKQVFRFKGCLHTAKARVFFIRANFATFVKGPSSEDQLLVPHFDSPKPLQQPSLASTGLFHHPLLQEASQFKDVATITLSRAQRLVDRIVDSRSSPSEMRKVVKNLDRLSDMLCSVIDVAELVRNAHPDRQWVQCADEAYDMLCEFMAVLNTHVGLSETLKLVLADKAIVSEMSPEEHQTALVFWRDFVRSGLDLSPIQRERFVSLSSEIISLGRAFLTETSSPRPPALIDHRDFRGGGTSALRRLQMISQRKPLQVHAGSAEAQVIMHSPNEDLARRKLYLAFNSSTPEQLDILERLLRARAELARSSGKESFAHMVLDDKMAKSPEHVQQFLETRMSHMHERVVDAVRLMANLKKARLGLTTTPPVYAWDRMAFTPPIRSAPPVPIPALTAGRVFLGLSRLFSHLYGVSLRPAELLNGEVWHRDVRKLEVVHEDEGIIGWLYIDLYRRPGKASGAAHYTVVCSRRTDHDDEQGDFTEDDVARNASVEALRKVLPFNQYKVRGRSGTYQLPVAVLLSELLPPATTDEAVYLEWQDVLTLCHEMGHALHSMLGRTDYQNISGTRCATDFVELPSILMEYFMTSSTVLSLFTETNSNRRVQYPSDNDTTFAILDNHTQLLLSYLDQVYHSALPLEPGFDSTLAYSELHAAHNPIPYVPGTSWQTQFGHLYSYGATYYSYMLDRAIAGRVWQKLFRENPLGREVGEKFKQDVLIHGGGRDPWEMVGNVLDTPELIEGDSEAIREVARWSVEDDVASTMRL
ncbi:mitochondrial intermediate peptidase [Hysterangium stoloniferum]|nr:mitochondrial intermediate peptidase [Hysterangium stoloniferum]